jgi:hypothetical protein
MPSGVELIGEDLMHIDGPWDVSLGVDCGVPGVDEHDWLGFHQVR